MKKLVLIVATLATTLIINVKANHITFLPDSHVITPEALNDFIYGAREDRRKKYDIPYDLFGKKICRDLEESFKDDSHNDTIDKIVRHISKQKSSLTNEKIMPTEYWTITGLCGKLGFVEPKKTNHRTLNIITFLYALYHLNNLTSYEKDCFSKLVSQTPSAFEKITNIQSHIEGVVAKSEYVDLSADNVAELFYAAIGTIIKTHLNKEYTHILPKMYILVDIEKNPSKENGKRLKLTYIPVGLQACYNNYSDQEESGSWGAEQYATAGLAMLGTLFAGYAAGNITFERECNGDQCVNTALTKVCDKIPMGNDFCYAIEDLVFKKVQTKAPLVDCSTFTKESIKSCYIGKKLIARGAEIPSKTYLGLGLNLLNGAIELNEKQKQIDLRSHELTKQANENSLDKNTIEENRNKLIQDQNALNEKIKNHNEQNEIYENGLKELKNKTNENEQKENDLKLEKENIDKIIEAKNANKTNELQAKEDSLNLKATNLENALNERFAKGNLEIAKRENDLKIREDEFVKIVNKAFDSQNEKIKGDVKKLLNSQCERPVDNKVEPTTENNNESWPLV